MKRCKKAKSFVFLTLSVISLSLFSSQTPLKADWKSDANARIEQNRKRNAEITVVDALSQPVSGINVQISQKKHSFAFGTCIANSPLNSNAAYKNFILSHFEWAVCENESKWTANESTQGNVTYTSADNIYNWCHNNGIPMRGHCIFWEQPGSLPSWVTTLGSAPWPQTSALYTACQNRLNSVVPHFQNKFLHWDVDNEQLSDSFFDKLEVVSTDVNSRVWMYQRANQLDPNCKLFVNEYSGNSFGGYNSGPYVTLIDNLRSKGAPIHGIGIQAHLNADVTFDPATYYSGVLQPLAVEGLPIWATEFDASHTDANISADNIENFFRICFSHSSVEGIIMWGFMNGQMWRANAGLCDSSGNLTTQGHRYESLMSEWTTSDANITNSDGNVDFRGFHGTYQITLSSPGQTAEVYSVELEPGSTLVQFEIQTALVPPGPDNDPPTPDPLEWLIAPHATGSTTIAMTAATAADPYGVQYYFDCLTPGGHDANWQDSPSYQDAGLNPNTQYTYRVKARDKSPNHNETGWTSQLSATTQQPGTDAEIGSWSSGLSNDKTEPNELGANRLLIFIAHEESISGTPTLTSVTYGGQAMTKVIERSAVSGYGNYVAAFILNESGISAATSAAFTPTWSSATSSVSYASVFLSNVNQTTPVGPNDSNGTVAATPNPIATNPLATGDGDIVIEGATCGNLGTYTLNNGFIEGIDQAVGSAGHTGVTGHKKTHTASSEIPSATYATGPNRQAIIGFVVKAAPLPGYYACPEVQAAGLGLLSDLNHDCYVDYLDLYKIALYWLHTDCAGLDDCEKSDFEPDGDVDFIDFNTFGLQWMLCNDPENPDCTPNW